MAAPRKKRPFDPRDFLAKAGIGRKIAKYSKSRKLFSQGEAADAVFYILAGKVKLTVVSEGGKKPLLPSLGRMNSSDRAVSRHSPSASRQPLQ